MGRPLNKRLFTTAAAGATAGANEIKVNFHNGSAVVEGTIIKQTGSKRFKVAETGANDDVFTCTLKTLMTIAFIKYFKIGMWDWYEIIELAAIIIIVCYIVLKRKPWKYRNNIPKALLVDLMPLVSED